MEERVMKRCDRCARWHASTDSDVCEACWVEMGQLNFDLDDEYEPVIDSVFDRMAERENRFP
jgi:hypothetical protein